MTPSPHPPHMSYGDGSSPHAVDAVVAGNVVPIGIPALFIADQLSRGRPAERVLRGKRGLIAEYAGAEGYAYRWGHVIEVRLGRYVLWRIVPVAMWDQLTERRARSQLLIDELLTLDPWNDAYHSVIILIMIVHGSPPPGNRAVALAVSASTLCRHLGADPSR